MQTKQSKFTTVLFVSLMISLVTSCADKEQEYTQLETCVNHYQAESYQVAKKECEIAAEQGSSHAQWLMANLYRYELIQDGVDLSAAFDWYLLAAKNGHIAAMREVGQAFMYGEGVIKDFEQAHHWLKKAAESRDAEAEFSVGVLFFEGWGRAKDVGAAISWFKRAGSQGHNMSINNLAWILSTSKTAAYFKPKRAKIWIDKLDKILNNNLTKNQDVLDEDSSDGVGKKSNAKIESSPIFLDTKAAVLAANQDFEQAIKFQNLAIAQLPPDTSEEQLNIFQQHLDRYLQGKDWRE